MYIVRTRYRAESEPLEPYVSFAGVLGTAGIVVFSFVVQMQVTHTNTHTRTHTHTHTHRATESVCVCVCVCVCAGSDDFCGGAGPCSAIKKEGFGGRCPNC